mgnify:CR=1 FL=1
MGKYFQWERFIKAVPQLTPYLSVTAQIALVGVVFGTLFGLLIAWIRVKKIPVLDQILTVYISFMRGTPLLAQLMLAYYVLPVFLLSVFQINIGDWEKIAYVELAFVLNEGAFLGEIFRSAIEAVPYAQTEAGYSVGLTGGQTFFRIVLPQAVKVAIPAYGIDIVWLFHSTSVACMVGVMDLLGRARSMAVSNKYMLEAYAYVALLYVVISVILRLFFKKLEKSLTFGKSQQIN